MELLGILLVEIRVLIGFVKVSIWPKFKRGGG